MKLTFLKAGTGDSILIHHKKHNILVDGGNDSVHLIEEIKRISARGENLDLMIITHHDEDHIKGIIDLLNYVIEISPGEKSQFIKEVIFNSPKLINKTIEDGESDKTDIYLSYKQAHEVENLLKKIETKWSQCYDDRKTIEFDGLTIDFLSPTIEDCKLYSSNKGAYLASDYKCDWKTSLKELDKYIDDKSQDTSLFNKTSIVIDVKFENKRVLLTGDVTPGRLEIIIKKLVETGGQTPVKFDYIKLPHHGSYRSLNETILMNIKCKNFIITTNSKKYFLPNKRAILKVLRFVKREKGELLNFHFNYEQTINNLNISPKEKEEYRFKLIKNNQEYGISL